MKKSEEEREKGKNTHVGRTTLSFIRAEAMGWELGARSFTGVACGDGFYCNRSLRSLAGYAGME